MTLEGGTAVTGLSAARLTRLAAEAFATGGSVSFTAPRYHGGETTVSWAPETAVAVAGHICRSWGREAGVGTRLVAVECERGFAVTLRYTPAAGDGPYRLRAAQPPGEPKVIELCGHDGCDCPAPAGPGTRCAFHVTDPVPAGEERGYWGRLAAEAWAATYNPRGERARLADNERRGVIIGGIVSGLTEEELCRITGIDLLEVKDILGAVPSERPPEDDDEYTEM
ncbi:hypothetical protein [Streptomyces thermogriseus]|uniref:Uncharacterized protein n=1 Tax=Streptomyces thermogriseus TaxID=75292 RepID=A0ABN1T0S6_9ACTN